MAAVTSNTQWKLERQIFLEETCSKLAAFKEQNERIVDVVERILSTSPTSGFYKELASRKAKIDPNATLGGELQRFLDSIDEENRCPSLTSFYELNVIARHPSIDAKQMFSTLFAFLSSCDQKEYKSWMWCLNDIYVIWTGKALEAERAAGAEINRLWPAWFDDSRKMPFVAKA